MSSVTQPAWIEHLDDTACWYLLRLATIGRVAVIVDSAPEIYPVNFAADGASIVFRTDVGSKLRGIERSPSVCFEADGFDFDDATGWSVLVKGTAEEISDPGELDRAHDLPLYPWGIGGKDHWVRIRPREVTGRRIHRGAH